MHHFGDHPGDILPLMCISDSSVKMTKMEALCECVNLARGELCQKNQITATSYLPTELSTFGDNAPY